MNKKPIITIAGRPGSGKSTTSKALASLLGFEHFSSGDLFRSIVKERGIELLEANIIADQISEIDYLVDDRLKDIGATQSDKVIDSRMAWHWIPQSFKVYLDLDIEIAAIRILQDIDPERAANEHLPTDPKDYAKSLRQRLDGEARKYERLYSVNPYEHDNYDLVIDTNINNQQEVLDIIANKFEFWIKTA